MLRHNVKKDVIVFQWRKKQEKDVVGAEERCLFFFVFVCVCRSVLPIFQKNFKRDCSKHQTTMSLFCAKVFALEAFYEKSLYDSRAPTLLCGSLHFDLFQCRLTELHLIKGYKPKEKKKSKTLKRKLFLSISYKLRHPKMPLYCSRTSEWKWEIWKLRLCC